MELYPISNLGFLFLFGVRKPLHARQLMTFVQHESILSYYR